MFNKIKNILNKLSLVFTSKHQRIQTFTYFIPSPAKRETGYREKRFDKYFYDFINKGYEVISINTQQCSDPNQFGMWFICTVRSNNKNTKELNLDEYFTQKPTQAEVVDNTITYPKDYESKSTLELHEE